ncbi:MAG: PEP-CTERM sorting domain-containing protein [Planctomycetaceae bacterium]|nr:PEP-CTERM sorting domain-containing protein [Planctomycetaceae bacterium]
MTFDQGQFQVASAAVPEPGTIGFGLGVMTLAYLRRRRSAAVLKDPAA